MNLNPNLIDLEDVLFFLKKRKKKLLTAACLFFVLACLAASYKKSHYLLKGAFKEGSSKTDLVSSTMLQTFLKESSLLNTPTQATSLMRSRTFCESLIKQLGYQAEIKRSFFKEWVFRMKTRGRATQDYVQSKINILDVSYGLPYESLIFLKPLGHAIEVRCENKRWKIEKKPQTIDFGKGSFFLTLDSSFNEPVALLLSPMEKTLDKVLKAFKIKQRREDTTILDLTFKDLDPSRGAAFLNGLMKNYEHYLETEREKISQMQLTYLGKRQQEIRQAFQANLQEHATYLEKNLSSQGFLALSQHLDALQRHKHSTQHEMQELNLKLQMLEQLQKDKSYPLDDPILKEGVKPLQEMLLSITKDKQQRAKSFLVYTTQPAEIFTLHGKNQKLYEEKKFKETLAYFPGLQKQDPYASKNLKASQERLALAHKDLETLEHQKKGLYVALSEIEDPSYEVLHAREWVEEIASIPGYVEIVSEEKKLKDSYFSTKEKQKIQEGLFFKKKLFASELKKQAQVLEKKIGLQKQNIVALDQLVDRMLDKEESFVKQQIQLQWQEKQQLLALESQALEQRLAHLQEEEKKLPCKWLQENRLRLDADLNLALMEGLARMIESKNIEYHLAFLQSSILDPAFVPLKPQVLLIVPFGLLGAGIGVFAWVIVEILLALRRGFPMSIKGLQHRGIEAVTYAKRQDLAEALKEGQIVFGNTSNLILFKSCETMGLCLDQSDFLLCLKISKQGKDTIQELLEEKQLLREWHLHPEEALKLLYHPDFDKWQDRVLEKTCLTFLALDLKEESFLVKALICKTHRSFIELKDQSIEKLAVVFQKDQQKIKIFHIQDTIV
jgi:uncharacterized protein involved in exopolysaccharide biosynthesis